MQRRCQRASLGNETIWRLGRGRRLPRGRLEDDAHTRHGAQGWSRKQKHVRSDEGGIRLLQYFKGMVPFSLPLSFEKRQHWLFQLQCANGLGPVLLGPENNVF